MKKDIEYCLYRNDVTQKLLLCRKRCSKCGSENIFKYPYMALRKVKFSLKKKKHTEFNIFENEFKYFRRRDYDKLTIPKKREFSKTFIIVLCCKNCNTHNLYFMLGEDKNYFKSLNENIKYNSSRH